MEQINIVLSGILLIVTFVIVVLAFYSIQRKEVPGAIPFFFLCVMTAFYTFGYGMELLSQSVDKVDFWSKFQYIGLPFIPAIWVVLSISYTRIGRKYSKAFYFFLFLIPFLTCIFRMTSMAHNLQYGAMRMISNGYFLVLDFEKGPWYYFHLIYFILCAIYSARNYQKIYMKANGYLKQQSLIMVISSLMTIFAVIFNVFSVFPLRLDSGPFFVIFNYLLLTYGIFRYNLLHLIPLSREKVFDWIHDGVLVFDMQFNIVDFNKAAGQIFKELSKDGIGLHVKECLSGYMGFVEPLLFWQLNMVDSESGKIKRQDGDDSFEFEIFNEANQYLGHYLVRMSVLYEKEYLIGSTVMINDITKQHEILKQLEYTSRTDGLTGLLNRRYFDERMEYEISRAERLGSSIALILFDIDYFKKINDTWGHQAGDHVMKVISMTAAQNMREIDLVGRYGGEEFIILLPDTGLESAILVAERIRTNFETADINWCGSKIHVSASFGVTVYNCQNDHNLMDYDALVRKADEALYLAKRKGRNRVEALVERTKTL